MKAKSGTKTKTSKTNTERGEKRSVKKKQPIPQPDLASTANLADHMLEGCQIIGPDWRYLYLNDAAVRQSQFERAELIGHTMMEMYPGIEGTELFTALRECMQQRTPRRMDNRFTFPNGEVGFFQLSIEPVPEGIFILSVDVTERQRAAEELRKNEELLKVMGHTAQVGGWELDPVTGAGQWTDEVALIHDLDPDVQPNQTMGISFYYGESQARIAAAVQEAIQNATPYDLELEIVSAKGAHKWVRTIGHPVQENGRVVRLRGSMQDITERKQAERQLLQMQRLYATLSQVNQAILRSHQWDELFQSICDLAVQFGGFSLAWVGLLDEASGEVRPMFAKGLDLAHWPFKEINIRRGSLKDSLSAAALRTSKVVTSDDLLADQRIQSAHPQLEDQGYRSSASVPFCLKGKPIGVLALMSDQVGFFKNAEEVRLLEEMGKDISFALDAIELELERKQAEAALKESEERFSTAFFTSPVSQSIITQGTNEIMAVNDACCRLFGYSRQELVGAGTAKLNLWETPADRLAALEELRRTGHLLPHEATTRTKAGEIRTIVAAIEPISWKGLPCLITSAFDITERKQAEQNLRESEARFREAIEFLPIPMGMADRQGHILLFNHKFTECYGYTAQDTPTIDDWMMHAYPDPEYREAVRANWNQRIENSFREGVTTDLREFKVTCKNGDQRDVEIIARGIGGLIITSFNDITERKQAGAAIASLAKFPSENPSPVLRVDMLGNLLYANDAGTLFLKAWGSEMGQPVPPEWRDIITDVQHSEQSRELNWTIDDRVFSCKLTPIPASGYVNIYGIDITERKQAEEQLLQMQRLYATLSQVNQTIVRSQSREELFQTICDVSVKFAELSLASIGLLDEASGEVRPVAWGGLEVKSWPFPVPNINQPPFKDGLIARSLRTAEVMVSEDLQADPGTQGLNQQLGEFGYRSTAAVPFRLKGQVIGVLTLVAQERGRFKDQEGIRLLEEMGMDISFALDTLENERVKRQWADAFEHSGHGMVIGDPGTNTIRTCNPAFAREEGGTVQELIGLSFFEMYAPKDRPQIKQFIEEADRTGRVQFETEKLHRDGTIYWVEMEIVTVRDEKGKPLYRVTTQKDITERKQAEKDTAHLASIVKSSYDAVITKTLDGVVTSWNAGAERILGYSAEEMIGQPIQRIIPPEHLEEETQIMNQIRGDRVVSPFETVRVKKDGTRIDASITVSPVRNARGQVIGASKILRDISELKQARQQLETQEKYFRSLIEHNSDAITVVAGDGRILYESPSALRMMSFRSEDVMGTDAFGFVHPDDQARGLELLMELVQNPGGSVTGEIRYRHTDGAWHWVEATGTNLLADSNVNGIVVNYRDITERKQAEEQRAQLAERLNLATHSARMGIWDWDIQKDKLIWDEQMYALYGLPLGEFGGAYEAWLNGVHPDDREAGNDVSARALRGESEYDTEFRVVWPDGSVHWLKANGHVFRDERGTPLRMVGVNYDITGRKQAEEALRASEAEYRTLMESFESSIAVVDAEGTIYYANPVAAETLHTTQEAIIGKNLRDFFSPYETELQLKNVRRVITSQEGMVDEMPVEIMGKMYWYRTSIQPVFGASGQVEQALVNIVDVTEHKRAEQALLESEIRYRSIFNGVQDAIFVESKDGWILGVNQRACDMYGYSREEFLTKHVADIVPDEEEILVIPEEGQISPKPRESFNRRANGEVFPVEVNGRVETIGGEQVLLVIVRDITARRQTEQALQLSEQRYRTLFEDSPLAIWEEDFSTVKKLLDQLKAEGVTDFRTYFASHPEAITQAIILIRVLDVNNAALQMYEAESKQALIEATDLLLSKGEQEHFFNDLLCIAEGKLSNSWEGPDETMTGKPIEISLNWSVFPGHEQDYSKVIVTTLDITERKRAEAEIHRQLDRLGALRAIDTAISASFDLNLTMDLFLQQVLAQLHVDSAAIVSLNKTLQRLEYIAGRGFTSQAVQKIHLRSGEGYASRVIQERRLVHVASSSRGDAINMAGETFAEYYGVPLVVKGQVNGVLEVFLRQRTEVDADWLDFLYTLGGQAAIAMDNAQLFEGLQRSNLELSLAYDNTIEGWSRALDLRDKETEGHTQRVTELTLKIAQALGLGDAELVRVRRGALLHDIGKMGIPDSVLLKPGPLTDEEWVVMRKHPVYAYELLQPIRYLASSLDIPYCHHEKWDGSGYPRGLKGEEIPLTARIFAIVDVWDALRSNRPYREAWPEDQVRAYIQEQSGKHFDPRLVEIFLGEVANGW